MKLSICMIVKDEEANLERCLDSFAPLIYWKDDETLEPLTELIIVDTGSTDRTVQVAKKHTDNVYTKIFDPWDFSAARNYSFAKAKGEWILYLDADESLAQDHWRSLYNLKDAVLNPNYLEYRVGFVWIDNFPDKKNLKLKKPFRQARLFNTSLIDGNLEFTEKVHNKLKDNSGPYIKLDIRFDHYGYMFKDNEKLIKQKAERSLPLLLEAHEKDPHDTHALNHLCKTYQPLGERNKVIEFGEKWLVEMKKVKAEGKYHRGWEGYLETFILLAEAYVLNDDEKNISRIEKEAAEFSVVDDLLFLLWAYWVNKDQKRAVEYAEIMIEAFKKQVDEDDFYKTLRTSDMEFNIARVFNWISAYYYKQGDLYKSGKYLNEGIYANQGRLMLRWDIYNYEDDRDMNIWTKNN